MKHDSPQSVPVDTLTPSLFRCLHSLNFDGYVFTYAIAQLLDFPSTQWMHFNFTVEGMFFMPILGCQG